MEPALKWEDIEAEPFAVFQIQYETNHKALLVIETDDQTTPFVRFDFSDQPSIQILQPIIGLNKSQIDAEYGYNELKQDILDLNIITAILVLTVAGQAAWKLIKKVKEWTGTKK